MLKHQYVQDIGRYQSIKARKGKLIYKAPFNTRTVNNDHWPLTYCKVHMRLEAGVYITYTVRVV